MSEQENVQELQYCSHDSVKILGFDVDFEHGRLPVSFVFAERPSSTVSADREEPQPPPGQALVKPEDLEPVNPAGSLKSVRTLVKQQADPDQFRTMSSVIGLRDESRASGK